MLSARQGRRVMALDLGALPPADTDAALLLSRAVIWALSRLSRDAHFQANGLLLLVQCGTLGVGDVAKIVATLARSGALVSRVAHCTRQCLPMRLRRAFVFQARSFLRSHSAAITFQPQQRPACVHLECLIT